MDPDNGRVVSNPICQALRGEGMTVGSGSQTRSFQFVDDLVEGIVRPIGLEYCDPIDLGNPEEYTVLQLACEIKRLTRSRSENHLSATPRRRSPETPSGDQPGQTDDELETGCSPKRGAGIHG
jgi:nucleoside-diphosphate-sugar epimerase